MKKTILAIIVIIVVIIIVALWKKEPRFTEKDMVNRPQMEITQASWGWEKTSMKDGSELVPQKPESFTLTFSEDGSFSGTTDCNNFSGTYTLSSDGIIAFGPFMSTLMFCEGSQETEFTSRLSEAEKIVFTDDGKMEIKLAYEAGSMMFTQKP